MSEQGGVLRHVVGRLPAYLGTAFGTTYAAQTGDAVSGAIVGQIIEDVGNDFVERVLSPRQEDRVATVVRLVAARIGEQVAAGETLRNDGFFDDEVQGQEVLEGVLLAARDSYEQKKLPYLANVFAQIATDSQIDAQTAHLLIRRAEAIPWLEMCLLALVADPHRWQVPEISLRNPRIESWPAWTVLNTLTAMRDSLIYAPLIPAPAAEPGRLELLPETDYRLTSLLLNATGTLLVEAMQLNRIPDSELTHIREQVKTVASLGQEDDDTP